MANYFVSVARGNDTTGNGTAATPWKTIAKAVAGTPAITLSGSGTDRLYLEPGVYYETVTLALTPTLTNGFEFVGDCDGAGFAAGGYATPTVGIVEWAAWTSDVAVTSSPCLSGNGKSYVAARRLKFYGCSSAFLCVDGANGKGWTFSDCQFIPHTSGTALQFGTAGSPAPSGLALTVDRCDFILGGNGGGRPMRICVAETAAEYSIDSVVRNCRVMGGSPLILYKAASTGLGFLATGLQVVHCTFFLSAFGGVQVYAGESITLATPVGVAGCIFIGNIGVIGGGTTHIAEDYNTFHCFTPRTSTTAGANSSVAQRPVLDYGDGRLVGAPARPFLEPLPGGPYSGAGGTPQSTVDLFGRPRPGGLGSTAATCGALERGQAGRREATVTDGDALSIAIDGPGVHQFQIPLKTGSNSITIKARYDANHGTTNKPRVTLKARPECGVASDVTATMTVAASTWETLTLAYTATSVGWAWLQLESRAAAGNGIAYFDTVSG